MVASAIAIVAGGIVTFLGLARLGWLVDFISLASISAFMTGAAITICMGQVPTMMGLSMVDNRAAPYHVFINVFKHLEDTTLDAAMGISALVMLYMIRSYINFMAKRQPARRRVWFFVNTLRTVFVIMLYTMISWLVNRNLKDNDADNSPFKILGTVPRGFRHAGVPELSSDIVSLFAKELPASVIVLVIEHISIAKSFGRINNYSIDPSQEFVAIGVTNLLAPFVGGFPSTGSFSRTAIKSKAGVRTPLAGVITAFVVLLAIYALPAVFFYIPSAALAGVIIHAVGDLITPPNTVYQFWKISPIEVLIFFVGVLVTVFNTIEFGIYATIAISLALLLYRVFKARGRFLGRVTVHSVVGDHLLDGEDAKNSGADRSGDRATSARNIFLPIGAEDGSNPEIKPQHPYPGIFIYRFSEGYNYPNANHYLDYMTDIIFQETRRTNPDSYPRPGDRPWNDPGPKPGKEHQALVSKENDRPTLQAIILDFSSVNNVDITSVQHLIDVRNHLDRHASPNMVQWHFACITNRWTKRALASAGFGFPVTDLDGDDGFHRWKPIFSVAELGGSQSAAAAAELDANRHRQQQTRRRTLDIEDAARSRHPTENHNSKGIESASASASDDLTDGLHDTLIESSPYGRHQGPAAGNATGDRTGVKVAVVHGLNRPFFHIDLTSALQCAIHNVELRTGREGGVGGVSDDVKRS